jgi:hypothetical protein
MKKKGKDFVCGKNFNPEKSYLDQVYVKYPIHLEKAVLP